MLGSPLLIWHQSKLSFGIGGSYKIGWGQSINHVKLSSQGASIRSFLDFQLRKTYYLSGGYELNYQQAFTSFSQISSVTDWSKIRSGGPFQDRIAEQQIFQEDKVATTLGFPELFADSKANSDNISRWI